MVHTKEEFQKAFQVLFGRISDQEPINVSHLVSLRISCHSHGDDDEIIINVNCKYDYHQPSLIVHKLSLCSYN